MKIDKLTLSNFKGTTDAVYVFTDQNLLSGKNGAGKTTVADAIIFALYGTTRTGNKSTDSLLKHGEEQGFAEVEINGHVIKRSLSSYGNKLSVDGVEQDGLDLSLDVHQFLNVFLPGEILELSTTERRTTFIKALPKLDLKEIFIEHTARPDLAERVNFDFLDKSAKALQAELKDAEIKQLATKLSRPDYNRAALERELGVADLYDKYEQRKLKLEGGIRSYENLINTLENDTTCSYCGGPIEKDETKIHEHNEDLTAYRKELAALEAPAEPSEPANVIRYKIQELDEYERKASTEGADLSTDIAALNLILTEIKPGGEIAKYVTQQADEFLTDAMQGIAASLNLQGEYSLKLSEKLKNGNYRDIFTVTRDGKPYAELSTGEKITVDILLAMLYSTLITDESLPIFIDDADLLSETPELDNQQVFLAEVNRTLVAGFTDFAL